jgi:hypothetical protein
VHAGRHWPPTHCIPPHGIGEPPSHPPTSLQAITLLPEHSVDPGVQSPTQRLSTQAEFKQFAVDPSQTPIALQVTIALLAHSVAPASHSGPRDASASLEASCEASGVTVASSPASRGAVTLVPASASSAESSYVLFPRTWLQPRVAAGPATRRATARSPAAQSLDARSRGVRKLKQALLRTRMRLEFMRPPPTTLAPSRRHAGKKGYGWNHLGQDCTGFEVRLQFRVLGG